MSAQSPESNRTVAGEPPLSSGAVKSNIVSRRGVDDVSSEIVSHAALLARIEVTAEEESSLVPRIRDFLRFVDTINVSASK